MILRLSNIVETAVNPAFQLLPRRLDTTEARVMLLAIGLQESGFATRRQMGNGPARGFWQFEPGTRASRGGVWGVYLHRASNELLRLLCRDRDCNFDPRAIWGRLEDDDVLAAGIARLLLLTDPHPLPQIGDVDAAWSYYLRNWRPGKPRPESWPDYYAQAVAECIPRG
jgi:hypothetical protein